MTTDLTPRFVLEAAALLLSDQGENPEYDRAIVELTSDLLGFSMDDREQTLAALRAIRDEVLS